MDESASPGVRLVLPPPPPEDVGRMLSAWAWLLPGRIIAVGVNLFGDWYLATPDGAIHLLSIWEGTFEQVAPSDEAWTA